MFYCITPNPALDITYEVPRVTLHATNRVRAIHERPGGKGINVARILSQLGEKVAVGGFLGGRIGEQMISQLESSNPEIQQHWTAINYETRRTIAVVDDTDVTMYNEAGPTLTASHWEELVNCLPDLDESSVVTISGSMPPGTRNQDLSNLISAIKETGACCIVDTSGELLLTAARAGADLVKPNVHELVDATGEEDWRLAANKLLELGVAAVACSLGPDGLAVITGSNSDALWVRPVEELVGNPTGAGDAAVASLARSVQSRRLDIESVVDAVALSGAAVLSPVAGEVDLAAYHQLQEQLRSQHNAQ